MDIGCADPYLGAPLAFYDGDRPKPISLVGDGVPRTYPAHFVGAVATVKLTVRRIDGKLRRNTAIREYVTVTAQSPDLPPLGSFEKTQMLRNGEASDIQVFGYDESDVAESDREAVRKRSKQRLWRVCRQELYLNDATIPFVTITRRYTLDAIQITDLQGAIVD
jgi:hypothetical protein